MIWATYSFTSIGKYFWIAFYARYQGKRYAVLLPEEGRWRLRRRLSRSELQRRSLAGAVWGELVLEGEVQTGPSAAVGPVTPRDPVIAQALDKNRSGRWSRRGTEWRLSFPWQIGQPVPLLPLFCFARPEGRELVFLLDETGYPAMHE